MGILDWFQRKGKAEPRRSGEGPAKPSTVETLTEDDLQDLKAKEDIQGLIAALRPGNDSIRYPGPSNTQESAIQALVEIGFPSVEPLIKASERAERFHHEDSFVLSSNDKDKYLRSGILQALGRIGDPRAVETILLALEDNIPFVRKNARKAYEQIGETVFFSEAPKVRSKTVIQALKRTADWDQDPEISGIAKTILKKMTVDGG